MYAGNNCGLSLLSTATASPSSNGNSNGSNGLNGAFANNPFNNTAFTLAPINRPSFSASAPCSVMSYSSNGPMSLGSMATCVKPTPLASGSAGFVKVEGGGTYYGGSYGLTHADTSSLSPCSSAASVCLSSLPFSHESYQLATGHSQAATGPLLAAVDANIRPFTTPTSAALPYIACDQCTSSGANTASLPHPTVFYNWAHQTVPMGSTTVLNHGFGLMSAHTPPPAAQAQCAPTTSNVQSAAEGRTAGDTIQTAQQEQENTSSPHESGYYSSTTSPAPNHHRYVLTGTLQDSISIEGMRVLLCVCFCIYKGSLVHLSML